VTSLRGMTWDHPRGKAPLLALAGRSGSSGTTTVEWFARSLQAFADHPLDELAATYDVLVIDHPHIPLVAEQGLLVPLDEVGHEDDIGRLAAESVGECFASYQHGGTLWALALDAAAQVSVHRPDLIADPPSSWPEVLELAGEGRVLWPVKPVDAMSSFLTLAAQHGEPVCSQPGRFVGREVGLEVLDLMHRLADRIDPACLGYNPIDVAERLATEDTCCYAPLAYGYVNYSRLGFRPNRLAYRDMPVGPSGVGGSCLGGAGIAVSAQSAQRDAAVDVAFWLASSAVQRGDYYAQGGQPANALAWQDSRINADSLDFFAGTRRTLQGASVRPRDAGWIALQEVVGELVHDALARTLSDDSCLDRLDAMRARLLDVDDLSRGQR